MIDLAELDRLAAAATPGPMHSHGNHVFIPGEQIAETYGVRRFDDATYIAAADPTTIRRLVQRIRELEAGLRAVSEHAQQQRSRIGALEEAQQ